MHKHIKKSKINQKATKIKLINKNHFKFAFIIPLKSSTTLKITLIIKQNIITLKKILSKIFTCI